MYRTRIFIQVAESGSFSKAGDKLFLTSAAVMRQIDKFEDEVGVPLLERSNRGVVLTPAGEVFLQEARRLVNDWEQACHMARAHCVARTEIRVGTSYFCPSEQLLDPWRKIAGQYPQVSLQVISFDDGRYNFLDLLNNLGKKIDAIVAPYDSKQWREQSCFLPIGHYPICCAVSYRHRLAGKKLLEWEDLHGECLLTRPRGAGWVNDELLDFVETHHPEIRVEKTPSYYDLNVFNHCEQTGAILSSLDLWKKIHPSLVTIPLNWDKTVPYGVVYAKHPSLAVRKFIDIVAAALNKGRQIRMASGFD